MGNVINSVKQFLASLSRNRKKVVLVLGIIIAVALVPRGILLYRISTDDFLHNDGREYMEISRQLALGNGFSLSSYRWYEFPRPGQTDMLHTDLSRSPMFPLLGAVPHFLPWDIIVSEKAISLLLSLLAVYCVFLLGKEFAGPLCGLLAAFLFSFNPYAIYYSASWSTENLFLIFVSLAFFFLIRACKTSFSAFPLCAVFLALATMTRPTAFLLFIPFIILPAIILPREKRPWKELGRQTALFLGVFFLILLPWMIRNYKVGGQFTPMNYYGNYMLWVSSSDIVYETYRTMDTPEYEQKTGELWNRLHEIRLAELKEKGVYDFVDASRYWKQWGLDYIRNNPDKMAYILKERFFHYWRMCPILTSLTPVQILLFRIYFTAVFGLALAGLFLLRKSKVALIPLLPPIFGLLTTIPFLLILRYRYPFFDPYVSVFAAFAIAWFIGKNPERKQQDFFPQA